MVHFAKSLVYIKMYNLLLYSLDYSPLKPSLSTDLSGNTAVVDSPFNLTCSAEANPPPSYRFYRDETSLDTSAVEVYKTLVSEKRSPVNYSCTPYNEYGEGPAGRITVKVLCKYSYP